MPASLRTALPAERPVAPDRPSAPRVARSAAGAETPGRPVFSIPDAPAEASTASAPTGVPSPDATVPGPAASPPEAPATASPGPAGRIAGPTRAVPPPPTVDVTPDGLTGAAPVPGSPVSGTPSPGSPPVQAAVGGGAAMQPPPEGALRPDDEADKADPSAEPALAAGPAGAAPLPPPPLPAAPIAPGGADPASADVPAAPAAPAASAAQVASAAGPSRPEPIPPAPAGPAGAAVPASGMAAEGAAFPETMLAAALPGSAPAPGRPASRDVRAERASAAPGTSAPATATSVEAVAPPAPPAPTPDRERPVEAVTEPAGHPRHDGPASPGTAVAAPDAAGPAATSIPAAAPGPVPAPPAPAPATPPAAPVPAEPAYPVLSDVPLRDVPVTVGLQSLAGANRFAIRLAPEGLGRIDVNLDIRPDGDVTAHLVVEKADTLAALQRDGAHLHRALEQAGLRTGDQAVAFSLRDPQGDPGNAGAAPQGGGSGGFPQPGGGDGRDGGRGEPRGRLLFDGAVTAEPATSARPLPFRSRAAGVDLRI